MQIGRRPWWQRSTPPLSGPQQPLAPRNRNLDSPTTSHPQTMRTANSCPLGSQRCDSHSTSTSRNLPPSSLLAARPIISLIDYAVRSQAYRALSSFSCADPFLGRKDFLSVEPQSVLSFLFLLGRTKVRLTPLLCLPGFALIRSPNSRRRMPS